MKKAPGRRVMLIACGAALGALLLEASFRAFWRPADGGFPELNLRQTQAPDGTAYLETHREDLFRYSRFRAVRTSKTLRIAVLGESAAWGANYNEPIHFPHAIQMVLASRFPNRDVEVINGGLPGTVSERIVRIAQDLLKVHPDVIVAYMGNNECYSPSSALLAAMDYWLYRFGRWSALARFLGSRRRAEAADASRKYEGEWRSVSELQAGSFSPFEYRMRQLVSMCRANNVRLVLCTVAANESDWLPPSNSFFNRELTGSERDRWQALVGEAEKLASAGRMDAAAPVFESAARIAYNGRAQFEYGRCLLHLERYDEALEQFRLAIIYSVTRIKPQQNDFIRRLAAAENIPLVDIDQLLRERSPHGIIGYRLKDGKEVFDDDVHLSAYGQYLVAVWISQALEKTGLVRDKPARGIMSFDEYWRTLNVYPADLESSYRRIAEIVMRSNVPRAMHFVEKALKMNSKDPKALLDKGAGLLAEGDAQGAARSISAARAIDPAITEHIDPYVAATLRQYGYR